MIIMAQASSEQKSAKAASEPKNKSAQKPGAEMNKGAPKNIKTEPIGSERMFAVVLVRGLIGTRHDVKQTLISLRLHRKNTCIVRKDTPGLRGMLTRAKDYITWGEIDNDTYNLLREKRGEKNPSRDKDKDSLKEFFRLNPPRKGFGRKGIKTSFSVGGGLGYRNEDKMNDLLRRMI
jgi:large subunit ribosomal protein L30